ncbi:MAG: 6-phosphofructokinase [Planctomyces sp.]|jgi:6-phosphofructokinase|nr:6-phosphofructokinase [Planctomyces sp.]HAV31846.1 6-phosphofructokinase [Planctomycetaceae bacterium]HBC64301.1 6-phosphofructokinase [Planctomycetaceae bacterium]
MKRIGILTAGGDTPALNATIYGAVQRANALKIEVVGLLRGYAGLLDPQVPHVLLNPLYSSIPELDPCKGGTLIGSSRTYLDHNSHEHLQVAGRHAAKLQLDGLICIGGDGTINGMQPLAEMLPCVLAPKTIDNDLGLNYPGEPDEWQRPQGADGPPVRGVRSRDTLRLEDIINYATPGFATAVFVVVQMVERLRTTAESHHRIAVVEVMGRQSGYIALGAAYAQPDIILIPEVPVDPHQLTQQVSRIYEQQQNVVIVVGEGVRGVDGRELGAAEPAFDPAGNVKYAGAADAIVGMLEQSLSPDLFLETRRFEPGSSALFSRKVGHTQRGGRPILFDRFAATQLGGKAVELLAAGYSNEIATLQYSETDGFTFRSIAANRLRDRWGEIHPREVHPSLYDAGRMQLSSLGMEYLKPIFTRAVGADDVEYIRREVFDAGCLSNRYQSINSDIRRRIRYL